MHQNTWTPQPQPQPVYRGWRWLRTLVIGVFLFIVASVILLWSGDPNLFPTVILIGNFLVPVVFVAFLYDHQHISSLSIDTIAASFGIGGVLGILGATVIESLVVPAPANPTQGLSFEGALLVGLIEEGCKILAVIFLARKIPHTSQMDGLLLGGAVGMGFAALESTGYAFTALLISQGHISASISSTVLRGLLAPFGHGVWTGILGATVFHESGPRHFHITWRVILAYLFVSILHALWDGLPVTIYFTIPPGFPIPLTSLILGVIGLVVLGVLYRGAIIRQKQLVA
ncbi:MAG TPA: PrsW family glutamic-type intramembrane protease [Ktedonobacteraceae bacterium]|nr:PrsW family glutamic-type intramembrane protease [Ktedonobacteraceae bacterium]